MKVFTWPDYVATPTPRVVVQQGRCDAGHCGQFSISISNGSIGLTVRFDDEAEFRRFWTNAGDEQPTG